MRIFCSIKLANEDFKEQEKVLHSVMLILDLHIDHAGGSESLLLWFTAMQCG